MSKTWKSYTGNYTVKAAAPKPRLNAKPVRPHKGTEYNRKAKHRQNWQ